MTRDAEHTPSPQSVVVDTFNGDNAALVRSIAALLTMKNLTPPVPGLARQLLATSAARLASAPAPPSLAGGEVRDLSGETVMGMRVAAYRHPASCPPDLDKSEWMAFFNGSPPNTYCEHWSTPGEHRTDVERLFTEADVRMVLAALSPEAPAWEGVSMRAALEEIASRPLLDEPVSADGHRNRCPSCGHAWNIHKTPHHAPTCDRMTALAALTPRHEAPDEAEPIHTGETPSGEAALYRDLENGIRPLTAPRHEAPAVYGKGDVPLSVGDRVRVHTGEEGIIHQFLPGRSKCVHVLFRPDFGGSYFGFECEKVEAQAEGAGEQWLWRIPGRGWVLVNEEAEVVREARVGSEWVETEVIALSALRARSSAPEAREGEADYWCELAGRALDALDTIAADERWDEDTSAEQFAAQEAAEIRKAYAPKVSPLGGASVGPDEAEEASSVDATPQAEQQNDLGTQPYSGEDQ